SCPAANGIRCVNPSSATASPSRTRPATASRNDENSAKTSFRSLQRADECPRDSFGESSQRLSALSRPIIEIACAYRPARVSSHSRHYRGAHLPELNPPKGSALVVPAKPIKQTGDSDAFPGDPNFMTSLARGLAVIQAFS